MFRWSSRRFHLLVPNSSKRPLAPIVTPREAYISTSHTLTLTLLPTIQTSLMAEETQAAVAPPVDLPPSEQPPAPKPDLPAVAEKEAPPPPSVADVSTSETDSSVKLEKGESPADPEPAVPKSEAPAPQDEEQEKKREEQPAADALSAEHEKQEITEKAELQQPQVAVVESRSLAAMMEKEESGPVAEVTEKAAVTTASGTGDEDPTVSDEKKLPQNLVSFKEESNKIADLSYFERNALQELKQLVQKALDAHEFISTKEKGPATEASASESNVGAEIDPLQQPKADKNATMEKATVSIWGIPLLEDDRSDVILLKFLRARDFRVNDAFTMIKNTIQWRKEFGIDVLVEEDLGDDLEKVVFMHGHDREGHPVCFNVYGEFQNKELYQKTFSDEEKRMKFLRWRIQFLERGIRKLDFTPGGISTIFQVNDLKNSPGPGKRELRLATKQALQLLQDNYPEFVAKQVFINVPWWYLAFYTMISPFMTQRTKSKFVFARPSRSADTLFKYISPEQVPIQYGGLSVDNCDCNPEFSVDDPATEIIVKPGTKQTVEIAIYEKCVIVWEIRVVGWEVIYGAEFAPNSRESYTVIIQKPTKMSPKDEPVSYHSFKVGELGKILLTVDNPTSKKKKLLYRFKVRPFSD